MQRIAILFSGKGSNLAAVLEQLHGREVEVVVALTNNPQAGGIKIASEAKVPCEILMPDTFLNREAFDRKVVDLLSGYRPDLTVLAGFMRILTPVFTTQIRAINLHPSLLPRHKGLHAIEKSYVDPYPEGGVTVHWVTSELDGGEVLLQKKILKNKLSMASYSQKVRKIEKEALVEAIRIIVQEGVAL